MIDCNIIKQRGSSCHVLFKNLPSEILKGAIYIENEYHPQMNRYLSRWGWWLKKWIFNKYAIYDTGLTYLPSISKSEQEKLLLYQFPSFPKELLQKIPSLKTTDLLDYLEDPDDARFIKPGFLFYYQDREDGISVYDYYPLAGLDNKALSYKEQITEILKRHQEDAEEHRRPVESRGIGHAGL